MMKKNLEELLKKVIKEILQLDIDPQITISEIPTHGDYTSNAAMVYAKASNRNPIELAEEIKKRLMEFKKSTTHDKPDHFTDQTDQKVSSNVKYISVLQDIERIEVVTPGFINFFLSASALVTQLGKVLTEKESYGTVQGERGKGNPSTPLRTRGERKGKIMVEFAHPNTHKSFHIGHLRNITTGESIVRLLEAKGYQVIRANYQGDVGMHIAKCLYGILQNQKFDWKNIDSLNEKIKLLGEAYVLGNKAYEDSETAKKEIEEINKQIYADLSRHSEQSEESLAHARSSDKLRDPSTLRPGRIAQDDKLFNLYQTTRQWSLEYFEKIYKRVGTHFDRYYFESEVYELGKKIVLEFVQKGIFTESKGAIIFEGEKQGLHNRVFITKDGNATYEGKDIGLAKLQFEEFHPDLIIHVVGPEQSGYFQVLFKALEMVIPETKNKEKHLIYGWVRLKHGKMSSRSGNVILGEWLIDESKKEINNILQKTTSKYNKEELTYSEAEREQITEKVAIAAVKYSFLRVSTKQDIAFDLKESINFEGNSGPYLQYTYARARSVKRKSNQQSNQSSLDSSFRGNDKLFNLEEMAVLRLIYKFPEIVESSASNFAPNITSKYLIDLASAFNTFYNKHSILGKGRQTQISEEKSMPSDSINEITDQTSKFRLALTTATSQVIKNGLYLLGIETLEKM